MPSEIKASAVEELRLQNYRTQLKQRNEIELREMETNHTDEVQRTIENQSLQLSNLRQAYEVQISKEAEKLDEHLHDIRLHSENRVIAEKKDAEEAINKLKAAHQQRIGEYKKNSEAQLNTLHKQLQASEERIHEQAKKLAKKDKEVTV